jgi:hypothetical protein
MMYSKHQVWDQIRRYNEEELDETYPYENMKTYGSGKYTTMINDETIEFSEQTVVDLSGARREVNCEELFTDD